MACRFNPIIVLHCLAVYSTTDTFQLLKDDALGLNLNITTTSSSSSRDVDSTISSSCYSSVGSYCLEETKVCLHYARQLLRKQVGWREGEFLDAWSRAVPQPFVPWQEMLRGEVLLVKDEGADGEWLLERLGKGRGGGAGGLGTGGGGRRDH